MRFLLRRLSLYLLTLWAAVTINFFIPRLMPGDLVQALLNRYQGQMSSDAKQSLYVLFGLDNDRGLLLQYFDYVRQLLRGDLGLSFAFFPTPVSEVIRQALPWTIGLVGVATIISFLLGTAGGVILGWRRGTWADGLRPVTTFFSDVPYLARAHRDHGVLGDVEGLPVRQHV